jgi:hypothetical protein
MKTMLKAAMFMSAFGLSLAAAGCTSDEIARNEGVTGRAGDAIAADTVLQMVDPWPRGVENTNLRVPADHAQYQTKSGPAAPAAPSAGGASNTDN